MASRGISEDVAKLYSLGYVAEGDYAGRLSIPYETPAGVVAIKYRSLAEGKPKYLNEPNCGVHLYNARSLIGLSDRVILTEGEIDALTIEGVLDIPAVAYPGTDSWENYWKYCFDSVSEVIVIADGDDAGRKAADRTSDRIGDVARVVEMPDGDDANSFINREGGSAFIELLGE